MSLGNMRKFFLSIVLPSILAIALFIISFYVFLLPSFKTNMMEGKKEMISELTNTAWSLIDEYYQEFQSGRIEENEARQLAASRVGKMRYGDEKKDYFWITDMHPVMVMHPYRLELNKTDLSNYEDPQGKKLFVDAVDIVRKQGEGYIDYFWQWKDDTTQIVPKLSYVKSFPGWQWIIGTGIYLEDVQKEISALERRLFRIVFGIVLVIALSLLYVIRQSMGIENRRRKAEENLQLSRSKYKTLVESSTIGTLMMKNNRIVYANHKFLQLSELLPAELNQMSLEDLFELEWKSLEEPAYDSGRSLTFETTLISGPVQSEVMLSVSKVKYDTGFSFIIVVNELSDTTLNYKQNREVQNDLQTSLLLMNQPVRYLLSEYVSCDGMQSIDDALQLMTRKNVSEIYILLNNTLVGIVTANDIIHRAVADKLALTAKVASIMTSPLIGVKVNCTLSEAFFMFQKHEITHLKVTNSEGQVLGVLDYQKIAGYQQNYIAQLFTEVEKAETIKTIKTAYRHMNSMVELLVQVGAKPDTVTHLISSFSDTINVRVIELSIEIEGIPPAPFCFIAMGSQGRMEQTLTTDQDNGIIISDKVVQKESNFEYFKKLGKRINDSLHGIGYQYCNGDFMAGNPEWNTTLAQWKKHFSLWIKNSDSQSIIDVNIFFDFRAIYGDAELALELRKHLNEITSGKAVFFYQLSQEINRFKSPIGMFGKIHGKHENLNANTVDLKKLIMPITSFSRLYALQHMIEETNTLVRFELLRNTEGINDKMIDEIKEAYELLMGARFKAQLEGIKRGSGASNVLDINKLSAIEQSAIKKSLSLIGDLITKVKLDFRASV